jgi:NAD(P)-dependent dehydrogenase (short-subunit alcohol dehydrogenase family)
LANVAGKVVLVTGGGGGIGRAAAQLLAREGAEVIVTGLDAAAGADTVRRIGADGGRGSYVRADLSQDGEIDALFASIERQYGKLDCAFNNAGVGGLPTPILNASVDLFDEIFTINSRAVWLCMQRELRLMRDRRGGSIVNNSSVHGTLGMPERSAYVASKHAVIGMTKAVALEMARSGIRVNCLCPGATKTPMFNRWADEVGDAAKGLNDLIPLGRPAEPEEMAAAVLWLLSDESSYLTGQTIIVDGGFSIV